VADDFWDRVLDIPDDELEVGIDPHAHVSNKHLPRISIVVVLTSSVLGHRDTHVLDVVGEDIVLLRF